MGVVKGDPRLSFNNAHSHCIPPYLKHTHIIIIREGDNLNMEMGGNRGIKKNWETSRFSSVCPAKKLRKNIPPPPPHPPSPKESTECIIFGLITNTYCNLTARSDSIYMLSNQCMYESPQRGVARMRILWAMGWGRGKNTWRRGRRGGIWTEEVGRASQNLAGLGCEG